MTIFEALKSDIPYFVRRRVVATALVPLDCGRVLLMFVDLLSGDRWLSVFDRARAELRTTTLPSESALGISHRLLARDVLVGLMFDGGGGAVVHLSWTWNRQSPTGGEE
jgi:hypothetical protein